MAKWVVRSDGKWGVSGTKWLNDANGADCCCGSGGGPCDTPCCKPGGNPTVPCCFIAGSQGDRIVNFNERVEQALFMSYNCDDPPLCSRSCCITTPVEATIANAGSAYCYEVLVLTQTGSATFDTVFCFANVRVHYEYSRYRCGTLIQFNEGDTTIQVDIQDMTMDECAPPYDGIRWNRFVDFSSPNECDAFGCAFGSCPDDQPCSLCPATYESTGSCEGASFEYEFGGFGQCQNDQWTPCSDGARPGVQLLAAKGSGSFQIQRSSQKSCEPDCGGCN